ncbi:MAG: WbuC family cupin fold metalloprotein [Betaproteobacteria bacterium]|nr:WbuC family cupin fold metalloprotein [Betaproteobacteria bacterium]
MRHPELIDQSLLDRVIAAAEQAVRRRKNYNFHKTDEAACHRLLNALEMDSYIRPHRHCAPSKDETMVALRGRLGIVFFDDEGNVVSSAVLEPLGTHLGVNIPCGAWHTMVALAPGSVFFEAKAGPYVPLADGEKAPWAPAEGNGEAGAYLRNLRALFS